MIDEVVDVGVEVDVDDGETSISGSNPQPAPTRRDSIRIRQARKLLAFDLFMTRL
jgi:hypothetical protein